MSFGFGFGFPRRAAASGAAPSLNFDFTSLTSLPSRITFSRTSNATLTDSNGRVSYAPHNLLTNSEDFEAAAWQKAANFTSVSANAAVAPNGTTTADKLVELAVNNFHATNQSTAAGTYAFSFYAKAGERSFVGMAGAISVNDYALFNLSNGTVSSNGSGVTSVAITSAGDGWYRCSGVLTLNSAGPYIYMSVTGGTTYLPSYTGDGTSGIFIWGAQLNVANAPVNLLTFSEQFDNAVWTKDAVTVTANTTVAPDGATTGDSVVENSATSIHRIYQACTIASGSVATISVYAQAIGSRRLYVNINAIAGAGALFDLTGSGSLIEVSGFATNKAATVTAIGGGWYRCTVTGTGTGTANNAYYQINRSTSITASDESYLGDGTSGLRLWGAQLNTGSTALPYVATTSSIYLPPSYNSTTPKNLLGFTQEFDNAAWTKSNSFVQTNLLTWSEQFDNAAWSKSSTTVTANSTTAPDGTATADSLFEVASTTFHLVLVSLFPFAAGAYTFSVYLKQNGRNFVSLGGGNAPWSPSVVFDLNAGTVVSQAGGTGTITSVGNGWYRCTVTATATAGGSNVQIVLQSDATTTNYLGDVTKGAFLWGAQLVQGSVPGDYQVTTSAAAAVQYSDPNGTRTADKFVEDTATAQHRVVVSITTAAAPYTYSVYAKAGERSWLMMQVDNPVYSANFNLATGVVGTTTGTGSATITSIGSGWYRCSITFTGVAATPGFYLFTGTGNNVTNYTGDGTSGIYIWGAQLSNSASVDPYVYNPQAAPTSTAYYGPRFDYSPTTLAANGLLIEEQRTNLLLQSQTFDVTWNRGALNTTGTPPWINVAVAPDGTTTADALIPDAVNTVHYLQQSVTRTTGNYTASVYAKPSGYNFVAFQIRDLAGAFKSTEFNVSTGTVVGSSGAVATAITPVGNGWYRCVFTFDAGTGVGAPNDAIFAGSAAGNWNTGFAGDGTSGVLLWGAQLEAGSFATSYIPTAASQVTRAADNASMLGDNFATWFTASQGTFYASTSVTANGISNNSVLAVSGGAVFTTGNGMLLRSSNTQGQSGGNNTSITVAITAPSGTVAKFAFSYVVTGASNNTLDLAGNGTLATTLTTLDYNGTGTAALILGALTTANVQQGNRWIRAVSFYPTKLPNATLQTLTS